MHLLFGFHGGVVLGLLGISKPVGVAFLISNGKIVIYLHVYFNHLWIVYRSQYRVKAVG